MSDEEKTELPVEEKKTEAIAGGTAVGTLEMGATPIKESHPIEPLVDPAMAVISQLINDIKKDQSRIKAIENPTVEILHAEYHGTLLSILKDLAQSAFQQAHASQQQNAYLDGFQSWAANVAEQMDDINLRLDMVEDFGGGTNILPDDFELFNKVAIAAKTLASELLGNTSTFDSAAKEKLQEIVSLSEQMENRLQECLAEPEEDENDEDEEEENSLSSLTSLPNMS